MAAALIKVVSFALTKKLLGQDGDERPVLTILRRLFSSTPFDCYVVLIALVMWGPIPSMSPVFTGWCGGDHGISGLAGVISIVIGIIMMMAILPAFGML